MLIIRKKIKLGTPINNNSKWIRINNFKLYR